MIKDLMTTSVPTMCILSYAEIVKSPKLALVTKGDYAKLHCLVRGEWPVPLPTWHYLQEGDDLSWLDD